MARTIKPSVARVKLRVYQLIYVRSRHAVSVGNKRLVISQEWLMRTLDEEFGLLKRHIIQDARRRVCRWLETDGTCAAQRGEGQKQTHALKVKPAQFVEAYESGALPKFEELRIRASCSISLEDINPSALRLPPVGEYANDERWELGVRAIHVSDE